MFKRIQSKIARPASFCEKLASLAAVLTLSIAVSVTPAAAAPKYAGIVIDTKTGKTLYSENADALRFPASLTKMMTLYLTFEALKRGKVKLNTKIKFSANAAAEAPTKLGVKAGNSITVEQAILGLVTKSANDAATATAELLGGSESGFARMMTNKARQLGMSKTVFRNAHGLPNSQQVTTARDMAVLGMALRQHFPEYYHYFSTRSFTFGRSRMANHNRLLGTVRGVDGIKTGYTRASGFNLVSSVVDDNRSIVAVVIGGKSGASRNKTMKNLIAKYMPRASTRGGGVAIAKGAPAPIEAAAPAVAAFDGLRLPDVGPMPMQRHDGGSRIELAYAAPAPKQVVGKQALAATLRQQQVAIPTPSPVRSQVRSLVPPAPIAEVASVETAAVDPVTTSSTQTFDGWVIQLGAMPDRDAAMNLLSKAQGAAGRTLASAEPFTVAYENLYRARFGGFAGQDSAVAACRTLKKKGFACWATQN